MKLRASLPLGLLALSVLAFATQDVVLKRTPKVGDKLKYKMTGKLNLQGLDIDATGTVDEEVKKVEGDVVTTEVLRKTTANVGGSDQQYDTKETVIMKQDGTLVDVKGEGGESGGSAAIRLSRLNFPVLSSAPVSKDGTWTGEAKKDEKKEIPGYKVDYKLVGEEKVGDWDAYKIEANGKETDGSSPSKWKTTYWIAKTDGALLKSSSEITDVEYGPGITLSGKIELVRQP